MARIVSGPKYKRIKCRECGATIEYLPEEVQRYNGRDISGGPDGYERVKCPREGCKGHGYVKEW